MWVVTVFEQDTFRIFEFNEQEEASKVLEIYKESAILSFTM